MRHEQRHEDRQVGGDARSASRPLRGAPATRPGGRRRRTAAPARRRCRTTPSGSRTKILISSQVRCSSPRSIGSSPQSRIAWPVSWRNTSSSVGLSVRKCRTCNRCSATQPDHRGDDVVGPAADGVRAALGRDRLDPGNGGQPFRRVWIVDGHRHDRHRAVPAHQRRRRADVDEPAVVDDRHAVAQPLGLFHQVGGQEHGLAAGAHAAHQFPDGAAGLRVESGGQLVEEHHLRVVDERQGDQQPLLLAARQRHEPGVALVAQAELLEQAVAVDGGAVERCPQPDGLAHRDALLELRLLQLHADPLLQRPHVAHRIEPQHADDAAVGRAQPFDALHRGGLAGAVGADEAEDLALVDVEAHTVDRDGAAVGLAEILDADDGVAGHEAGGPIVSRRWRRVAVRAGGASRGCPPSRGPDGRRPAARCRRWRSRSAARRRWRCGWC